MPNSRNRNYTPSRIVEQATEEIKLNLVNDSHLVFEKSKGAKNQQISFSASKQSKSKLFERRRSSIKPSMTPEPLKLKAIVTDKSR